MAIKRWIFGTLAAALPLLASTPALASETDATRPAPVLVVEEDDAATPDPTCEVCAIVTKKASESDSTSATVTLTHTDGFVGDVELEIWLESGESTSLWVEDVTITEIDGDVELELEPGEGWTWDDVRYAWARYYTAP